MTNENHYLSYTLGWLMGKKVEWPDPATGVVLTVLIEMCKNDIDTRDRLGLNDHPQPTLDRGVPKGPPSKPKRTYPETFGHYGDAPVNTNPWQRKMGYL